MGLHGQPCPIPRCTAVLQTKEREVLHKIIVVCKKTTCDKENKKAVMHDKNIGEGGGQGAATTGFIRVLSAAD